MKSRTHREALLFAAPGIILVVGFFLLPLGQIFWLSFSEPVLGLQNYELLISSSGIHKMLFTTFRVCVYTSLICALLGYVVAYSMAHTTDRVRNIMFFFILVPFWVSGLIRAFAWLMVLRSQGLINSLAQSMGLTSGPLPISYNEFAVLVGMVHYMLPYAILPLWANMRGIDPQYTRAARGLGATPGYAFRRVFFPLSMPGVFAAVSLTFIMSLGFYIMPLLLSGGRVTMIAEFIAANVLDTATWGIASMLAVVLLVMVLGIYVLSRRFAGTSQQAI